MLQERDVEEGMSAPALDLGAYSRARPAALPRVPEQRHGNGAAHADVMDGSNTEEMMLGGSEEEQHPQVKLLSSTCQIFVRVTFAMLQKCRPLQLLYRLAKLRSFVLFMPSRKSHYATSPGKIMDIGTHEQLWGPAHSTLSSCNDSV